MASRMSARVMETRADGEHEVEFYVRSIRVGDRVLSRGDERDGWAAYREETVFVTLDIERVGLLRAERVSDAPRATVEEAIADMHRAVKQMLDSDRRPAGRLVRGEIVDRSTVEKIASAQAAIREVIAAGDGPANEELEQALLFLENARRRGDEEG